MAMESQTPNATSEDPMVEVFVPALVALLTRAEELAGRPLTENEVNNIRDKATKVSQPQTLIPALIQQRGYHDLYAPEAWLQWQLYKAGQLDLSVIQTDEQ
ncbi:hypothetical protein L9G74_09655 [Shewanella sp. C32]|uniref:Uncharacterized protein n=1 Tax=Shewanella electrica TaxID=515560 RepID=A0ABT2FK44_9GAMM|nr:hypothetical protein [Shewanella electrica]MCH1924849.1 hypothetical protein [Shewanella electrica]MCS4556705.1 hypothetical protein [Shewanella electrica]